MPIWFNGVEIDSVYWNGVEMSDEVLWNGIAYFVGFEPLWYGAQGFFSGGYGNTDIDVVTIATTGNATRYCALYESAYSTTSCGANATYVFIAGGASKDLIQYLMKGYSTCYNFADMTTIRTQAAAISDGIRQLFAGGYNGSYAKLNSIEYFSLPYGGSMSDFGDLATATQGITGLTNGYRGVFAGGVASSGYIDVIQYVTMQTTGNTSDFGNLVRAKGATASCSSSAGRGLIVGGRDANILNEMDYITIATTGNASDFGDLTVSEQLLACSSNGSRAVIGGGNPATNVISYVTIGTAGNAVDFGDLKVTRWGVSGASM